MNSFTNANVFSCEKRPTASALLPSRKRFRGTGGPDRGKRLHFCGKTGAGEGIRTLDPNLGKVVLYP